MELVTLDSNAGVDDVLAALDEAGAVIVKDVIDHATVDRFNTEVMPYVERTPTGRDDFVGKGTKRTGALAARSATCRELILNELALGAAETFLQPFTSKIILHLTQPYRSILAAALNPYTGIDMLGARTFLDRSSRS